MPAETSAAATGPGVIIRRGRPQHHDAIRTLHDLTFKEHRARERTFTLDGPFVEPWLDQRRSPLARWRRSALPIYVAEAAGEVVGYVLARRQARDALIADISIAPAWRRKGVGAALLEAVERDLGQGVLLAGIWPDNLASIALFESRGYQPVDVTSDTPVVRYYARPSPVTPTTAKAVLAAVFQFLLFIAALWGLAIAWRLLTLD